MSLVVEVDGVPLPDGALTIRGAPNSGLPGGVAGLPLAAWYGEALTGGYVIDDPDGDFDFTGLHTIVAYETAATSRPFITGGWITGRRVSRGIYKDGPGRIHDVDFIDINWNFALMVFRASSAKRPAETDLARAAFIQASAPMAFTPSFDNGRFNTTDNPVNFDDSDLVTKYPIEAFNEFAGVSGKNFYNYYDNAAEEISLHYDLVGVGPAAGLAISNVIADSDSTTFYPFLDAELDQGPAYKVTGILFGYRGAYAYGIRQATIDDLSPSIFSPSEFQRDEVYTTDRVGRLSTAEALIQSMLEQRAVDTDTIKVSIRVPAAQVNDCYPGEIMSVKFTHLPGYETAVDLPIIRRNVVPTAGRVDMYDIHLELSGDGAPTGPGGGDPGPFPNQPCQPAIGEFHGTDVTGATVEFDWSAVLAPAAGQVIVVLASFRDTSGPDAYDGPLSSGWTNLPNTYAGSAFEDVSLRGWAKVSDGTETGIEVDGSTGGGDIVAWLVDGDFATIETALNTGFSSFPTVTVNPGYSGGAVVGLITDGDDDTPGQSPIVFTLAGALTQAYEESDGFAPEVIGAHRLFTGSAVTVEATMSRTERWRAFAVTIGAGGSSVDCCPAAGTPVEDETVALTGADGTTRCPFADGSLHVFIDNVEQTSGLVSQDGTTGDFTLGFDPTPTEVCTVSYLGR